MVSGDDPQWGIDPYLRAVASETGGDRGLAVAATAHVAAALAATHGQSLEVIGPRLNRLAARERAVAIPAPPAGAGPDLLGAVYESGRAPRERRRTGAVFTPFEVASALTARALLGMATPKVILDPAVGGGVFLLAAVDHLRTRGVGPLAAVGIVRGFDTDPAAVAVTEAGLRLWALRQGVTPPTVAVEHGDALAPGVVPIASADLVVGNPPFLGQLKAETARTDATSDRARSWLGPAVAAYTDGAALFLLAARRWVRDGGRIALIQPLSVLGARDAAPVRTALAGSARLRGAWIDDAGRVATGVRVAAVVLDAVAPPPGPSDVEVWTGPGLERAATIALDAAGTWSPLVAAAMGTPTVVLSGTATVGDRADVVAGFRDQYYGLAPWVQEDGPGLRLTTSGLVDPARSLWGATSARFAKRTWQRPTVDLDAMAGGDAPLAAWFAQVRGPKVLVAAQTRVVEAFADERGRYLGSVPVISVVPHAAADTTPLAAAMLAPPVTAWALARSGGTALAADAVKLSAEQVRAVPLPVDEGAWAVGAGGVAAAAAATDDRRRRARLVDAGLALCVAHGVDPDPLLDWWSERLPPDRGHPDA